MKTLTLGCKRWFEAPLVSGSAVQVDVVVTDPAASTTTVSATENTVNGETRYGKYITFGTAGTWDCQIKFYESGDLVNPADTVRELVVVS